MKGKTSSIKQTTLHMFHQYRLKSLQSSHMSVFMECNSPLLIRLSAECWEGLRKRSHGFPTSEYGKRMPDLGNGYT